MRRKALISLVCAASSALLATTAFALVTLSTAGGFSFAINETTFGQVTTTPAYNGAYYFHVNGLDYSAATAAATISLSGRGVDMAEVTQGALRVRRYAYVPMTGGDWIRYLDCVSNPGATAVTATLGLRGNLGSDTTTTVAMTSDGDRMLENTDTWFVTDDTDMALDPSLSHVFQGLGAPARASTVSLSVDNFTWSFARSIPAGGRVCILSFGVQASSQANARAAAESLVELPAEALFGIDPTLSADIVNFAPVGSPRVAFTGPTEADEGAPVDVTAMVTDPTGDTVHWSWDINGDGTFGEHADEPTVTVPAGTTDGPGTKGVAIRATDGTYTVDRVFNFALNNIDPIISSSPPSTPVYMGVPYSYQVMVTDPGGTLDPITYMLMASPSGMTLSPTGLVEWTPVERDVTVSFTIVVDDGDMGTDEQTVEILVSPNRRPMPPTPVSPIMSAVVPSGAPPTLVATNGVDPDGDTLTYFFRVDKTIGFTSASLVQSGELPEGAGGETSWTVTESLTDGYWYWEVWVSDGVNESTRSHGAFQIGSMPGVDAGPMPVGDGGITPRPDGGTIITPPPPEDDGGCGCRTAGAPRGARYALVGLMGALAGVVLVRRKRRSC